MINTTNHEHLMKTIWSGFVNYGRVENNSPIPDFILKSWQRCKMYEVDPYQTCAPEVVSPELLHKKKTENRLLIEAASETMEDIYSFIKGSEFVFALFDKEGYTLKIIGDKEVIDKTKRGNWREGACWNELKAGTNAVSLAIIEDRPIQVKGYEHYCRCSHHWSGSAAPIHDPNGNLLGILDLTGRHDLVNPHTLGMIVSATKSIERMLTIRNVLLEYQIANNYKKVIMDVIDECLMVIDSTGIITHINASAAKLLNVNKNDYIGYSLNQLFPDGNESFFNIIDANINMTDEEVTLKPKGSYSVKCLMSKRTIIVDEQKVGIVVTFYKSTRIKNLAKKFSSATKTFDDLVGNDISFRQTIKLARAGAMGNANILILGESGSGKDMLAQAIHNASPFSDGPFVPINCAAIPHDLIASELFGYADGVFTGGAKGGKPGKLELAQDGTLFLDEIGDMPSELQTTLLRVIENKMFMRVGGDREIPVNERIIAATNKDLIQEIKLGHFRADLYYRLNIVTIEMPPLRGRSDEIKLLLDYFIDKLAREMGKPPLKISKSSLEKLLAYDWPGNIRQLNNLVARSYYFDFPDLILTDTIARSENPASNHLTFKADNVETFERKLIKELLEQNNYAVNEVAKKMGQSRSTLYRKIRKYNILTE